MNLKMGLHVSLPEGWRPKVIFYKILPKANKSYRRRRVINLPSSLIATLCNCLESAIVQLQINPELISIRASKNQTQQKIKRREMKNGGGYLRACLLAKWGYPALITSPANQGDRLLRPLSCLTPTSCFSFYSTETQPQPDSAITIGGNPRNRRWDPLPIPHGSIPEPNGQDLDFINVAHSHLIHSDWVKLDKLAQSLTTYRIKHVLLRVQKDYVLSLEFYKWVNQKQPHLHSLETHSMILHILTKNFKFKSAEMILKGVVGSGDLHLSSRLFETLLYLYRVCDSSPRVFDLLFKTFAHMKKLRCATDVFDKMKDYSFLPTIKSCNAFMSSLLSLDRGDIILSFYRSMQRCHISPNDYTFNMVIAAYCNLGNIEKAVEIFDSMETVGTSPTVVSYNTLISGYCEKGLITAALKLKNTMVKKGMQPTEITFNTLIYELCKEGKLYEANKIFGEMKAAGVVPNVVTFNILINGYSQMGNTEIAHRFHEEMARAGIKADIVTYNALILGLCKEGRTKNAASLVKEIDKKGLAINSSTFAALIYGQCIRKNSERAFELYKSMIRNNFHPNNHTCETLISSFCMNEDFDGALQVYRDMLMRCMIPVPHVLSELFDGLCQNGKDDLAVKLYEEIKTTCSNWNEYENFISFSCKPVNAMKESVN